MGLTLVTAPTVEPVTVAEVRTQSRLDIGDASADYLGTLIQAAREWCEGYTGRSFVQTTWRLTLDRWPSVIYLPRPELRSVSSIKYDDTNGTEQTLSTSVYKVDADAEPARIALAYGQVWPSLYDQIGAVRITFVAGYADDGASPADYRANIPRAIRQAVVMLVAEMYERREAAQAGVSIQEVPFSVRALLDPYRHTVFD